jgi:hypothetical protein
MHDDPVMNLKGAFLAKNLQRLLVVALVVALLFFTLGLNVKAQVFPEYQRYVHNYLNAGALGNWTYVEKPVFPVRFNLSQISIGQNWSVVCPLRANHSYHVYCYGDWVNTGPAPKTDYDIYVYNPQGELESQHTEAAGLPEHLGTSVNDAFFVPAYSGNYTFVITNDARESNGAQQTTFMIIENVECDRWYTHSVEGKNGDLPAFNTSWAYEFVTDSPRIELWVKVPDALDMYEARLYLMSNPKSFSINNVSLPWEPGLYGNKSDVGGYNLESEEYRGVAYASCEFSGQDMFLNYTAPFAGKNLYHLVFMGEVGSGTIDFLVKTTFGGTLSPLTFPKKVYPSNETVVAYVGNSTELENAVLRYTTDDWKNFTEVEMAVSNRTCNATIPRQDAGVVVEYEVQASDTLKNNLTATGNFTVKHPSSMSFNATRKTVILGENITVTGTISSQAAGAPVTVQFIHLNETKTVNCTALTNGTFTATFQPGTTGIWTVQATFSGSKTVYECESGIVLVTVEEPSFLVKNGLFIGGGLGGGLAAVGVVVYIKKYRQ